MKKELEFEKLEEEFSKNGLKNVKIKCKPTKEESVFAFLSSKLKGKFRLDDSYEVTVIRLGDYKTIVNCLLHKNRGKTIIRHSGEYYNTLSELKELMNGDSSAEIIVDEVNKMIVNKDTGQAIKFREFEDSESRTKYIENLKKSGKKGLELALTNFNPNTYWQCQSIILTYKGEMTDYDKLSKDFDIFMKRLRRLYVKLGYKIQFIRVNELTEKGNWHIHLLIRLQDVETGEWIAIEQKPVSPNEPNPKLNGELTAVAVREMWGHGDIQMFNCKKSVAGYVYYLFGAIISGASVELNATEFDELSAKEKKNTMQDKRHSLGENETIMKKAERLENFPKNAKIYTPSKNLDKPTKEVMTEAELQDEVQKNNYEFHSAWLYAVEIAKKSGKPTLNLVLRREYWNEVRKPKSITDSIKIIPQATTNLPVNAPSVQPVLPVVTVPAPAPLSTAVPATHTKPIRPPVPVFEQQEQGEQMLLFGFEDNFSLGGLDMYRKQSGY
ncbi:MAG: hypothetical protein K2K02_08960 [Ruminococcus sp.]|nr:hypothetical protein [Ruminococcus sp.]